MKSNTRWKLVAIAIGLAAMPVTAWAEERTWTDKSGKFNVAAELVAVEEDQVILRTGKGQEIKVELSRLSKADRKFIAEYRTHLAASESNEPASAIREIAERFYSDLRNRERDVARLSLTKKAQSIMAAGQSPLVGLPQPEVGETTIRPGRVKIDAGVAEIPVVVRAGGALHQTKLHLRQEGDQWVVFALSATYPDGEKSINFEAEGITQQNVDPLRSLVGKQFELEGYTLDGQPIEMTQYKNKIVLVDFWATWCGPCRAEIPNIAQNWQQYHEDGFEVIAVSIDQDLSALRNFVGQENPPWTVVADNHPRNPKSMAARYGIRSIPAFILVGTDGKVAAIHCRGERLGQHVGRLLAAGG